MRACDVAFSCIVSARVTHKRRFIKAFMRSYSLAGQTHESLSHETIKYALLPPPATRVGEIAPGLDYELQINSP